MNNAGLIRAIRGAPLTVLVTLLLHSGQQMGAQEIVTVTGYSDKTVANALETLRSLGLAQSNDRYNGWHTTAHVRQLILPAPSQDDSGVIVETEFFRLPGSSGSDLDTMDHSDLDHNNPTTTTNETENFRLPDPWPDLVTLLVERCTTPPAVARETIARVYKDNCYPSYVRYQILRWLAYCLSEHGRSVRHKGSYIAGRIAEDIPCPEWFRTGDNGLSWEIYRAKMAWEREQEEEENQTNPHPASPRIRSGQAPDAGEEIGTAPGAGQGVASPLAGGTEGGPAPGAKPCCAH